MKAAIQSLFNTLGYQVSKAGTVRALAERAQAAEAALRHSAARVAELEAGEAATKREALMRHLVQVSMIRYAVQGHRDGAVAVAADAVRPYYDATTAAPPYDVVFEVDYEVFRAFDDPSATVLDIGANVGLAASSMRNAGCRAAIVSFEPNPWHQAALARLRDAWAGRFDYIPLGLGAARQEIAFTTPVVEDVALDTLATADLAGALDWGIPENVVLACMQRFRDVERPRIRFCETVWTVDRLDDVLATARLAVPLDRIVAIKIDVEGFEPQVLVGAADTLARHRPLVMIEGANRQPEVAACFAALGYRYADYDSGTLRLTEVQSDRANGFFLPHDRLDQYRAKGVLAA